MSSISSAPLDMVRPSPPSASISQFEIWEPGKDTSYSVANSQEDSVSLGQSGQNESERALSQLEKTLHEKNLSMEDVLRSVEWRNLGDAWQDGLWRFPKAEDVESATQHSITTAGGLRVDVSTSYANNIVTKASVNVTRANGQGIAFEADGDVRLTEREDGSLGVTFAATGETRVYAADGTMTTEQGAPGSLAGTDGDDVFLQLTAGSGVIDAGAGDDAILVLAGNVAANGGDGNDTIIVGKFAAGVTAISGGSGNDTLRGHHLGSHISVDMGDGDDTVELLGYAGQINLGSGNNSLTAREAAGELTAGDGDNSIAAHYASGAFALGNGNNMLAADSWTGGSLSLGNGNNNVAVRSFMDGELITGDGSNEVNIDSAHKTSLQLGDGHNTVTLRSFMDAELITGDGGNEVNINSAHKTSFQLGDGDNTVTIRLLNHGNLTAGDGDNALRWGWASGAALNFGNGDNILKGGKMDMTASLNVGDGNNTIEVDSAFRGTRSPRISAGHGQNNLILGGKGFKVSLGAGQNTLAASPSVSLEQAEGGRLDRIVPSLHPDRYAQAEARLRDNERFMQAWEKKIFG